jgi:hypothetical protein
MPLQRLAAVAKGDERPIGEGQIEEILARLQTIDGLTYWSTLDVREPYWLEGIYQDFFRPRTPAAAA